MIKTNLQIHTITDLSSPELAIYANRNEASLYHMNEPAPGIFIAESPKVILRALEKGYQPISFLIEESQMQGDNLEIQAVFDYLNNHQAQTTIMQNQQNFEIAPILYTGHDSVLSQITGFHLTRGMLCAMQRQPLPSLTEICQHAKRIAILENVVNPTNVGAIMRSAAALHIDGILLTAGCSDPLYRRAIRVSMGCVFQIPWTMLSEKEVSWPGDAMKQLRGLGFKTAAMALTDNSISLADPTLQTEDKLAIILGTEGEGLMDKTIADCDYTVRIPMSHGVDSLNVAAASAVAFWQLTTSLQ